MIESSSTELEIQALNGSLPPLGDIGGGGYGLPDVVSTTQASVPTQQQVVELPSDFSSWSGYGILDIGAASHSLNIINAQPPYQPSTAEGWTHTQINTVTAWNQGASGQGIIVAVIDSGVDFHHDELTGRDWHNLHETPDDGIDNDGNGYIDDIAGWDFVEDDNSPTDENGHGTNIAGIIAARADNVNALTGVAPEARIMALRALDAEGRGVSTDLADAIRYATQNGAHIINLSLSLSTSNATVQSAIQEAVQQGVLLVAAAGNARNSSSTTGLQPNYPALYLASNGLIAGASTASGNIASFSNLAGSNQLTHILAPGSDIFTTSLHNSFEAVSGTSFSTAFLSGAAAALMSLFQPHEPNSDVRDDIISALVNNAYRIESTLSQAPQTQAGTNAAGAPSARSLKQKRKSQIVKLKSQLKQKRRSLKLLRKR